MSDTRAQRFWAKVSKTDYCWIWTGSRTEAGYGQLRTGIKAEYAHRVSMELAHGPIPEGLIVRHLVCDNPPCVNPDHLAIGTQSDNVNDMIDRMRHHYGTDHHHAKLDDQKVVQIQRWTAAGVSFTAQAARLGVTDMTIHDVVKGQTWKHITQGQIPHRPHALTDTERAQIVKLYKAGMTQKAIATELHRGVSAVCNALYAAGLKHESAGRPRR